MLTFGTTVMKSILRTAFCSTRYALVVTGTEYDASEPYNSRKKDDKRSQFFQ